MNKIEYFKSAWGDIKNSPGWLGKLCLLALLNFVPVFGQIVAFGYLYGWAREIAWGTHQPMPAKILANEDGKLYRRGWFIFVLVFVFSLIPGAIVGIGQSFETREVVMTVWGLQVVKNPVMSLVGTSFNLVGIVLSLVFSVFAWIGSMRVAIYDRLSAGFQFGKIWSMLRHDTNGILRIFGMNLLFALVLGLLLSMVFMVLIMMVITVGVAGLVGSGFTIDSLQYLDTSETIQLLVQLIGSAGLIGIVSLAIASFLMFAVSLFVDMLVTRAMGYWTMQFDVALWGGQDDPMPFELNEVAAQSAPVDSPYWNAAPSGQPYDGTQAQPQPVAQPAPQAPQPASQAPQPASQSAAVPQGVPQSASQSAPQPAVQVENPQPSAQAQGDYPDFPRPESIADQLAQQAAGSDSSAVREAEEQNLSKRFDVADGQAAGHSGQQTGWKAAGTSGGDDQPR